MPENKTAVTLSVDSEVLKWFEAQGADFQHRVNFAVKQQRDVTSKIYSCYLFLTGIMYGYEMPK